MHKPSSPSHLIVLSRAEFERNRHLFDLYEGEWWWGSNRIVMRPDRIPDGTAAPEQL